MTGEGCEAGPMLETFTFRCVRCAREQAATTSIDQARGAFCEPIPPLDWTVLARPEGTDRPSTCAACGRFERTLDELTRAGTEIDASADALTAFVRAKGATETIYVECRSDTGAATVSRKGTGAPVLVRQFGSMVSAEEIAHGVITELIALGGVIAR